MFFTWKEFADFVNLTPFEVFMFLIAFTVSTFLLTVKLATESSYNLLSWWTVLSPLFIFDLLSSYFCVIVFVRQYQTGAFRGAITRAFLSSIRISLHILLKMFLCFKWEDRVSMNYTEVFVPIFVLLFIIFCRSIRL